MSARDPDKTAAAADFAVSVYRSDDAARLAGERDETPEVMALNVAVESLETVNSRGVLTPLLRARLNVMTQEYAKILVRLDRLSRDAEDIECGPDTDP